MARRSIRGKGSSERDEWPTDPAEQVARLSEFFETDLRPHFEAEEACVFPVVRDGPGAPARRLRGTAAGTPPHRGAHPLRADAGGRRTGRVGGGGGPVGRAPRRDRARGVGQAHPRPGAPPPDPDRGAGASFPRAERGIRSFPLRDPFGDTVPPVRTSPPARPDEGPEPAPDLLGCRPAGRKNPFGRIHGGSRGRRPVAGFAPHSFPEADFIDADHRKPAPSHRDDRGDDCRPPHPEWGGGGGGGPPAGSVDSTRA